MYTKWYDNRIQTLNSYGISTNKIITDICTYIRNYDADKANKERYYIRENTLYAISDLILYCNFDPDELRVAICDFRCINGCTTPWPIAFEKAISNYLDGLVSKTATKRYVITESEYVVHTKTYIVDVNLSKQTDLNTDEKALAKLVKSLKDNCTDQHTETYTKYKVVATSILNGNELKASADTIEGADS